MKSLKVIDGKVCIIKKITPNTSLPTIKHELLFSTEQLLCALEKRMDSCVNALHEAVEKDLVTQVTEHQVYYIDKNQAIHAFNIPSFEEMEKAAKKLQDLQHDGKIYVPCKTIAGGFNWAQLNQMKKAIVSYFECWSDTASALEELETYKQQKREC